MRTSRSLSRGLSLVELLVAVGIVLVLMGIVFSVLGPSLRSSKETVCRSNLHQISAALEQYNTDNGGDAYPKTLLTDWSVLARYTGDSRVLKCPEDNYAKGANEAATRYSKFSVSYWPVPSEGDGKYLEALQNADPNHGVVYCLMHTVHTRGPSSPLFNRKGKVLVALKSGSVVNRNMTEKCYLDREGHMVGYSFIWPLLTDAPMPEAVWKIEADVPYGSREVPCP